MSDIFRTVLNMSITGACIAAALILLRLPMKKLPAKFSYFLWAILGVRLLCPFSFSSAVSLFNLLKPQTTSGRMEYIPSDIAYAPTPNVNIATPQINENISSSLPAATPAASVNPMQLVLAAAATVWLVGIAVILIYSVISYVKVKKRVATAVPLQNNVYVCDGIETPFVYGIIKPKIYIPSTVSGTDLDYIIAHEQTHIRRGDCIVKLIGLAALILHWFNPLVWLSFKLFEKDMERSCDEAALGGFETDVRKEYASALLNISMKQNNLSYGGMLSFGESNIKSRIKGVLAAKKPAVIVSVIAAAALLIAAVCLLTNAKLGTEKAFSEAVNGTYNSYYLYGSMWTALRTYGEPTADDMNALLTKLRSTSVKGINEPEPDLNSDPNTYRIGMDNDSRTVQLIFSMGKIGSENGVPCCEVNVYLPENEGSIAPVYFRLKKSDWDEIIPLFNTAAENSTFNSKSEIPGAADVPNIPEPKRYDNEPELCKDYLTAYISALYLGGDTFYPYLYSYDSDMQHYAALANEYDKRTYFDSTLLDITVHTEKAVRTDYDGGTCYTIPYEVSYRYSGSSDESGYGKTAYFETESTDDGYKILRALTFNQADLFATGYDEKAIIHAPLPMKFNIEAAVSALLSQKPSAFTLDDFKAITVGTPRSEILTKFGEPESSLSGMYGDIYVVRGTQIVIYYDFGDDVVSEVKIFAESDNSDLVLTMQRKEYDVNSDEIIFTVKNNTAAPVGFNRVYALEYNDNGVWKSCPANSDPVPTKIQTTLKGGESREESVSLKFYDLIPNAEYRFSFFYNNNIYHSDEFSISQLFEVKIYNSKGVYSPDENIGVYATVEYKGRENEITVFGSNSCVSFNLDGTKLFNNSQGMAAVPAVLVPHTFKKGEIVRTDFSKSGGWGADDPNAQFYEKFYASPDLKYPADAYRVVAQFSCMLDEDDSSSAVFIGDTASFVVNDAGYVTEQDAVLSAKREFSVKDNKITNYDNPIVESISFTEEPPVYRFNGCDALVGRQLYKITFKTEADGLLGPIVVYIDKSDGMLCAAEYRE